MRVPRTGTTIVITTLTLATLLSATVVGCSRVTASEAVAQGADKPGKLGDAVYPDASARQHHA